MKNLSKIPKQLGDLSSRWLKAGDSYRQKAVKRLVASGYTEKMAHAALNATFKELTEKKCMQFLRHEIGNPEVLDNFVLDRRTGHRYFAAGPKNIVHIFSSNIPNPAIWSLVMGLLVKSKNILKPSEQDSGVLDIYLESLKKASPGLSKYVKRISSRHAAVTPYLKKADAVVCYGDDATIQQIRSQSNPKAHFSGYGHRASYAVVMKEALTKKNISSLAANLATDAWMVAGRGCLSPLAIYAQAGGEVSPQMLGQLFREKLNRLYAQEKLNYSKKSQVWVSSLKVQVKPFKKIKTVLNQLSADSSYLQAVALECAPAQRESIAKQLSGIGFNRICRAGQMQTPPITWHHDGKPNIASWLTWTDLE